MSRGPYGLIPPDSACPARLQGTAQTCDVRTLSPFSWTLVSTELCLARFWPSQVSGQQGWGRERVCTAGLGWEEPAGAGAESAVAIWMGWGVDSGRDGRGGPASFNRKCRGWVSRKSGCPCDCSRAFPIIFYFSHLFLLRFFHSRVPEAAEISSSPRADFKQTVSQAEEAHGISLLSVSPYW